MTIPMANIWQKLTQDDKQLGLLLTPSWPSAVTDLIASLALSIGALIMFVYRGSDWQYLAQLQRGTESQTLVTTYQAADKGLSANVFISNIPLLIFWTGIGLIVYSFASGLVNAFRNAVELHDEMDYVNVNRRQLIVAAVEHLLFRVVAFVGLMLFIIFTVNFLAPYIIATAYISTQLDSRVIGAMYLLWGIVLGFVVMHVGTILVRLVAIRPRLFG